NDRLPPHRAGQSAFHRLAPALTPYASYVTHGRNPTCVSGNAAWPTPHQYLPQPPNQQRRLTKTWQAKSPHLPVAHVSSCVTPPGLHSYSRQLQTILLQG